MSLVTSLVLPSAKASVLMRLLNIAATASTVFGKVEEIVKPCLGVKSLRVLCLVVLLAMSWHEVIACLVSCCPVRLHQIHLLAGSITLGAW